MNGGYRIETQKGRRNLSEEKSDVIYVISDYSCFRLSVNI